MKTKLVIAYLAAMIFMISCSEHYCPTYGKAVSKPGTIYKYKKRG